MKKFNNKISLIESALSEGFNLLGIKNKRGPRHRADTAGVYKLTSAEMPKADMVADFYKKKKTPFYQIEMLRDKPKGFMFIDKRTAEKIIKFYMLDGYLIEQGKEKQLSNSKIYIGYNKNRDKFYLKKI